MKQLFQKTGCYFLFLLLLVLLLTDPQRSLFYAENGLLIWFHNIIPALFPFMILSGVMTRMNLSEGFSMILHRIMYPLWHIRQNAVYVILMGFLCGFPMGARTTVDLYGQDKLYKNEANWLLSFCNLIGPVYLTGFVLPFLHRERIWPYLTAMYGIPLCYGLVLRHTVYSEKFQCKREETERMQNVSCQGKGNTSPLLSLTDQLEASLHTAIGSIVILGGYMILFQVLQQIPEKTAEICIRLLPTKYSQPVKKLALMAAPLLEIAGGISLTGDQMPLWCLLMLPFGGLCCTMQTLSILKATDLSGRNYIKHKLILTGLTFLFYMVWYLVSPGTFLQ